MGLLGLLASDLLLVSLRHSSDGSSPSLKRSLWFQYPHPPAKAHLPAPRIGCLVPLLRGVSAPCRPSSDLHSTRMSRAALCLSTRSLLCAARFQLLLPLSVRSSNLGGLYFLPAMSYLNGRFCLFQSVKARLTKSLY